MRIAVAATVTLIAALFVIPSPASAAGGVTCDGHRATIVGTGGNDVINGTSGNDVINGLGGRDVIHGGGGDDFICGGPGGDRLYGGAGNDQLFGQLDTVRFSNGTFLYAYGDVLDGGPGNDRLVGGADSRRPVSCPIGSCTHDVISWHSSPRGVLIHIAAGTADGDGHDRFGGRGVEVDGSTFGDTIYGSAGADWIASGGGNDWVDAEGGPDVIEPDSPSIHAAEPASSNRGNTDRVFAGSGNDFIGSAVGPDILQGGSGNDSIAIGRDFDDDFGDPAGPADAVQVFGGSGDDFVSITLLGPPASPRLFGGTGTDEVYLSDGHATNQAAYHGTWNMTNGAFTMDAPGGTQTAAVHQFENALLGGLTWTVRGTDGPNFVDAQDALGPVEFFGLGGGDTFRGSGSGDTFNGGSGTDHSLGMGDGDDTCISVEILDKPDCEHVTP